MPKGGKTADFKKRKQKLGKKKLAPTSTTATQFKTRSVVLLEQAQFADGRDTQPTTSRGSHTLPELLAQLRHYSPDVRRDALLGLNDLLHDHPSLLHTHAAEVLSGAAPLVSDTAARVRRALLTLLGAVLPRLEQSAALAPHEPLLRLNLQAALSREEPAVRVGPALTALPSRPRPLSSPPPSLGRRPHSTASPSLLTQWVIDVVNSIWPASIEMAVWEIYHFFLYLL